MRNLARRSFLALALCAAGLWPAQAQEVRPILFFAAASLQPALNAIAASWKAETGKTVTFSYAASSALAKQLDAGAPADLFASADLQWMDWAQGKSLLRSESRKTLLGNTLVLIAPRDAAIDLKVTSGFALAAAIGDGRLATGNPQSVPVGKYAMQALTALGVWQDVGPKIAGTDNVRAALSLVARSEAKLGIVYATDAHGEPKVRVVDTFPANTHAPVVYPFAITATSTNPDAQAFLAYLSSPVAIRIFTAEGFIILK